MRNNFKNLDEDDFGPPENVLQNVEQTLGIFRYLGQIADVFLPKIVNTVIEMSGGKDSSEDDKAAPNTKPDPSSDYTRG